MSAALIRKCNKCSAPFIKENGCNKVCSRSGKHIYAAENADDFIDDLHEMQEHSVLHLL